MRIVPHSVVSEAADKLSRINQITLDGGELCEYDYLGMSTAVTTRYFDLDGVNPALVAEQSYATGGSGADRYAGFDQFGRIIETLWKNGARTPMTLQNAKYGYNAVNEITSIANTNPMELVTQAVYDPAGNMTTLPKPGDWTEGYDVTWDGWNRIVLIKEAGTSNVVARYAYDGLTRRTTADSGESTDVRHYYYNRQWRCVEEYLNSEADAERRYVWNPRSRWQMILRQRSDTGTLDENLYTLYDAMDPVAVVDESGDVKERYAYSAFGETTILNSDFTVRSTGSAYEWNLLFHVEFRDGTGLYNYGFRYYLPALGRWLSKDPIGEWVSSNFYSFALNSCVSYSDFIGLVPLEEVWANNYLGNAQYLLGGIISGTMSPCIPLHGSIPLKSVACPEGVISNGAEDNHKEEVQCQNGCTLTAEVVWAYEGSWIKHMPPGSLPLNPVIPGVGFHAEISAKGDGCCCEDGSTEMRQTVRDISYDGTPKGIPRWDTPSKPRPGFGTIKLNDDRVDGHPFAGSTSSGPYFLWDTCSASGYIIDNPGIDSRAANGEGKNFTSCLSCKHKQKGKRVDLGCLVWGIRYNSGKAAFHFGKKDGKPRILYCGASN